MSAVISRPAAILTLLIAGCGTDPAAPPANGSAEAGPVVTAKAPEPLPDIVRVRLETEAGPIVVALDAKRAPITTGNFVRYVDEERFDGTSFYRAALAKGSTDRGFIQGGIRRDYQRMLPPIAHEPTSQTGLRHEAGTISMARSESGAGAMGDFFIAVSAQPAMDSDAGDDGYAVFGRVVEGMDVVRKILSAPTAENAGRGAMKGQMLARPVRIVRSRRIDERPPE
jgi:peptidyl-prolyl cis-trans isomerase A (cyclophilin A)